MRPIRFVLVLAMLMLSLSASLVAAQIRDEQSGGGTPLIIYSSSGELHTMEIDGSNNTVIDGFGYSPVWSPDGESFALSGNVPQVSGYTIVIYDLEGNVEAYLTDNGNAYTPFWSPDGERIAFAAALDNDVDEQIYVADRSGGNLERLTTDGGNNPAWSPDGEQIAFSSFASGTLEIWVMEADGDNIQQITTKGGDAPEFSPDGTLIAFVAPTNERATMASDPSTPTALFIMDTDGRNLQQITPAEMDVFNPSWSPDGTQIVFQADTPDEPDREIYIIDLNGDNLTQLTFNEVEDYSPDWIGNGG